MRREDDGGIGFLRRIRVNIRALTFDNCALHVVPEALHLFDESMADLAFVAGDGLDVNQSARK